MILEFPTLDLLRLALTAGLVPPAIGAAPARAATTASGQTCVEVPDMPVAELHRFGIRSLDQSPVPLDQEVCCWPQLLPLQPCQPDWIHLKQTAILFELQDADRLGTLAGEMLRLGKDRLRYRWLTRDGSTRAFLHVIGPPCYSLLRIHDGEGLTAYREGRRGLWVQLGFDHPLTDRIAVPPGKLLLLGTPREWKWLDDAPFRDIHEVLEFPAPAATRWQDATPERRWHISLKLRPAGGKEPAEMWVLRDQAFAQVGQLVQQADDALLRRLLFAVGERDGQTIIVLRARPTRQPPPVLALHATALRPYQRLANLYVPCGTSLQPPLSREHVVQRLAGPDDHITWLQPHDAGQFTPESIARDAFRPLHDWVHYVMDRDHVALNAWRQSLHFQFAPVRRAAAAPATSIELLPAMRIEVTVTEPLTPPTPSIQGDDPQHCLRDLEAELLTAAPENRPPLWPRLARELGELGCADEAAACWIHALWERDEPPPTWLQAWLRLEPSARDVASIIAMPDPSPADLRLLCVRLLLGEEAESPARVAVFLERHEDQLGVRLAWLIWLRIAGDDVLALARARERLLERLQRQGLHAVLDVPGFVQRSHPRIRQLREALPELHAACQRWLARGPFIGPSTKALADLMWAFAFARLGEASLARQWKPPVPLGGDPVHAWLVEALACRVDQELRRSSGPLPRPLRQRLEQLDHLTRYKIDRLREHSRILRQDERIDPRRHWQEADELERELAALAERDQRAALADRLLPLLESDAVESRIVLLALDFSPRLGESFAEIALRHGDALRARLPAVEQVPLLEKELRLAAHFNWQDRVRHLLTQFHDLLANPLPAALLEELLTQSWGCLLQLGLRTEIAPLLEALHRQLQRLDSESRCDRQRLALLLAGGWFGIGLAPQALPILAAARAMLFQEDLMPGERAALACAFLGALGQGPVEAALAGVAEVFDKLEGVHDTYTTHPHFSLSRLNVVEAAVRALVGDQATVDPDTRRWLDEDEYLVRRRIHEDMRRALAREDLLVGQT